MSPTKLHLIAIVAGQRIAISTDAVESVIEIGEITPVPLAPASIAGLFALRSRVLTVVDSLAALDLGRTTLRPAHPAVAVVVEGHLYGLLVDQVEDVVDLTAERVPIRGALPPGWARVTQGVVEHEGEPLLLIDAATLVAGEPAAIAA